MTDALIQTFRRQGRACQNLGSPFHAALLALAADDLEGGWDGAGLFAPWAEADAMAMFADAVPLRFLGGLHDMVLEGADAELAAAYPAPGRAADPARAWAAARAAVAARTERLAAFMAHEPQTNEVRRSVCLIGGFLEVARASGLPLQVFEIGSSAGLNLSFDRYRYDLGGACVGPADAPVRLDTDWSGPAAPVDAPLQVAARAACDRRPGDLTDPAQRRRLLAYIWPDQFERLGRIRAAIDLALELGVKVDAADAVAWTRERVAPRAGRATVLFHSVFWQYMPAESQAALAAAIADVGARAGAEAPFAWLRMEPAPPSMAAMEVRLTLWPAGEDRVLAEVHPHGAWVKWAG
ncbi:DUF2332 domain-containing protein [Phenylobacterium sp.]|uniref:DUF2332 domain-containing protein n=1 Tax=Phenylobacterium sp. TaxID=1871053 RepID=UPI0035B48568